MKLLSLLGLHEHRYTGRILHHHKTSRSWLLIVTLLGGGLLLSVSGVALADPPPVSQSFNVFAQVLGPPPATAPTIDVPTTGQTFDTIPITVSGTCTTGLVVKITSNNIFIGSAPCVAGTYSLQADIFVGINDLVAVQYDQFNQGSPPSNTVTVTYAPKPVPVTTQPKGGGAATTGPKQVIPTKGNQLIITSNKFYIGAQAGSRFTVPVNITGGTTPYAISWDWGDGTDLQAGGLPGAYEYAHTYTYPGRYTLGITVVDGTGQRGFLQITVLVTGLIHTTAHLEFPSGLLLAWPLYILLLLIVLAYWAGERHEEHTIDEELASEEAVQGGTG
jgi:hypothetical protein